VDTIWEIAAKAAELVPRARVPLSRTDVDGELGKGDA